MIQRAGLAVSTVLGIVLTIIAATFVATSQASAAGGAVAFVGAAANHGSGRTVTVPTPANTASGDLQVVVISVASRRGKVQTPSGWSRTLERRAGTRKKGFRTTVFTSRSTAPAKFTKRGRHAWQVARTSYRNVDSVLGSAMTADGATTNHTLPTMTPTDGTDAVMGGIASAGQAWDASVSSPWSERVDEVATSRAVGVAVADATAGSTSPLTGQVTTDQATTATPFALLLGSEASAARKSPSPTPTSSTPTPTTSTPTTSPSSPTSSSTSASITANGGTPWRPGDVSNPGYSNFLLGSTRKTNSTETTVLRSVAGAMLNNDEYSEPVYYRSTNDTAVHKVTCTAYGCIGGNSVPLTGNEVVAPGTDGQLIIVDVPNRRSYEFYQMARDADGTVKINSDGSVTAGSMSVVDLDGRGNLTPDGKKLNITGAGVSRLFGLIRANEVKAAATNPATAIPHALQVSMPVSANCASGYREPATKTDGRSTSGSCIQEGAHFYLDPSYNCSGLSTKMSQAICYALQKYGAYDMDNNGSNNMVVYGQHVKSWSTGATDYANVGIKGDYAGLGLPMSKMSSLTSWSGQ